MNGERTVPPAAAEPLQASVGARLRRGFSYSLVSQGLVYAIGFFVAPAIARALTLEEYGVVGVIGAVRSVLVTLLPMSAASAVTYWYNLNRKDERARRAAMGAIAGLALAASTVWLGLAFVAGPWLQARFLRDFPLRFWPYGALIVASAWFGALQSTPIAILGAAERMDAVGGLTLLLTALQGAASILLVVVLRRSMAGQVEALFCSAAAAAPYFLWLMFRQGSPRVDLALWRRVAGYALPFLPHQLSMWFLNLSDRLIISHYGVRFAGDLGLYAFSYNIAFIMSGVVLAFNSIWAPVFLEQASSNPRAKQDLGYTATWACVALATVASGLVVMAPEVIAILGGPRYLGSVRYVAPVIIAYLLQGVYMFPAMSLYHVEKTARLPVITVVSGAFNVGLNLIFVPRYGAMAAAWSTFASYAVMALLAFAMGHPPYPLHYRWTPLVLSALTIAGASVLMVAHRPSWTYSSLKVVFWLVSVVVLALWWRRQRREAAPPVVPGLA